MRTLPRLAVLLAAAGCETTETVSVDLRGVTAELAVAVSLDGLGNPKRVSPPFGVRNGALTYGQPPDWVFEGPETRLVVLGFESAAIDALYGRFARREGQAVVVPEPPPMTPSFDPLTPLDAVWRRVPVSNGFVISPEGARRSVDDFPGLRAELTLRLPVDPEPCPPDGRLRLFPFGAELDGALDALTAGDRSFQRLLDVAALDRNTALIGGPGLYVVQRGGRAAEGRATHESPDIWIPPDRLWPGRPNGIVTAIALRPKDADGIRRGVVATQGGALPGDPRDYPGVAFIHAVSFGPEGVFLDGQILEIPGYSIEDIDLDADGTFIAAVDTEEYIETRGRIVLGRVDREDFDWIDITVGVVRESFAIRWTGNEQSPIVFGADRAVYVSNSTLDSWNQRNVTRVGERAEVSELTRVPGRDAVWAAGRRLLLLKRFGAEDWKQVDVTMPPRFKECALRKEGLDDLESLSNVDAIAASETYVYASQENCNAVIAIRLEDECVAILTPDGEPARIISSPSGDKQLRGASYYDGQLLMVGDDGRIVTNLPP